MVVSNRYDPDPRVQKQAATLAAAGHRVRVFAYDRAHDGGAAEEERQGVRIHRLRLKPRRYGVSAGTLLGLREFRRAVSRILKADPPDVLHCHDQDTCALGLSFKLRRRTRFVFDAHDFYWTFLTRGGADAAWRRGAAGVLKAWHRMYARAADLLITVTDSVTEHPGTADLYRRWGCHPLVIWNAPLAVASPPALPARFTVGYYGSVREAAMFDWLLQAIEALPEDQRPALRLAGGGAQHAAVAARLRAAASRLGVPVRVTGPFAMEELHALMAECSLQYCLYPRGHENILRSMPVKLFEAVAHGRRVIGNAGMLMGDWIREHDWGWAIGDGDVAGLTRALGEAAAGLANRGQRPPALPPPPTWEEQEARLLAAYDRLLAGSCLSSGHLP